jgi:hypothetical protein
VHARGLPLYALSGLYAFLGLVFVATACGGGGGEAVAPQTVGAASAGDASVPASASSASTLGSSAASGTATGAGLPAPPGVASVGPRVEMKGPRGSAVVSDLETLGIDAKNLPPIEKLDPKALRGVMKLLTKSLGARCADCHMEGDFAAATRRKRIATKMWDEFVARLTLADGSPVFCDSCHQGRLVQLDRSDKKALEGWMDTNFVGLLRRKDGQPQACETCHVGMEMHLLAQWGEGTRH